MRGHRRRARVRRRARRLAEGLAGGRLLRERARPDALRRAGAGHGRARTGVLRGRAAARRARATMPAAARMRAGRHGKPLIAAPSRPQRRLPEREALAHRGPVGALLRQVLLLRCCAVAARAGKRAGRLVGERAEAVVLLRVLQLLLV